MEAFLTRIKAVLNRARDELSVDDYEELLEGAADELADRLDASADSEDEEQWEPEDD